MWKEDKVKHQKIYYYNNDLPGLYFGINQDLILEIQPEKQIGHPATLTPEMKRKLFQKL